MQILALWEIEDVVFGAVFGILFTPFLHLNTGSMYKDVFLPILFVATLSVIVILLRESMDKPQPLLVLVAVFVSTIVTLYFCAEDILCVPQAVVFPVVTGIWSFMVFWRARAVPPAAEQDRRH